ncbi:hypothetical protein FALBO_17073 [Fusarium albosuccineum]|uniref:Uncharacterized protein n=1 Tax=Fusarium albosuccineum TaxID=1237068 RepID=A0A8H4P2W6_9HYPO|nr:hypothetical protein FALBO_17073 [Fusarium albosuccineum]
MTDTTTKANTPAQKEASPSEALYTTATPIRFAHRGTRKTTIDSNVMVLDPRTVQQWQLDATEARLEEATNNLQNYKARVEELEVESATKSDSQNLILEELETLRDELDSLVIAQQDAKKGGWLPWKTLFLLFVMAGLCVFGNVYHKDFYEVLDYPF